MTDATELDETAIRRDVQVVRDHIPRGYHVAHRVADGALAALDEITRLRAALDEAEGEVERLRETNGRLNRRAQTAESAINELAHGTGNGKARPVSAEIWARCQEGHERHCPRATAAESALAAVRALIPDECWVLRSTAAGPVCTDMVGGGFPNGAKFTDEACCLPCRIRSALATPTTTERSESDG